MHPLYTRQVAYYHCPPWEVPLSFSKCCHYTNASTSPQHFCRQPANRSVPRLPGWACQLWGQYLSRWLLARRHGDGSLAGPGVGDDLHGRTKARVSRGTKITAVIFTSTKLKQVKKTIWLTKPMRRFGLSVVNKGKYVVFIGGRMYSNLAYKWDEGSIHKANNPYPAKHCRDIDMQFYTSGLAMRYKESWFSRTSTAIILIEMLGCKYNPVQDFWLLEGMPSSTTWFQRW
jgi:hypothetical protein